MYMFRASNKLEMSKQNTVKILINYWDIQTLIFINMILKRQTGYVR